MTMRRTKRYTVQSFKKKEKTGDPYAICRAPKGLLECPECHAIYHHKRWSLPGPPSSRQTPKSERAGKRAGKAIMVPQPYLCPACRKLRDGYAEGFISLQWPDWLAHKAEVLGVIHNEEKRASEVNPLERIMAIRTRSDGAEIETTTERMAQRIGRELKRAFHGQVQYQWSHKDKMARVEWKGPESRKKASLR